jgi:hypothetical protein
LRGQQIAIIIRIDLYERPDSDTCHKRYIGW